MRCEHPRAHVTVSDLRTTKYLAALQSNILYCKEAILQNTILFYKEILCSTKKYKVLQNKAKQSKALQSQSTTMHHKLVQTLAKSPQSLLVEECSHKDMFQNKVTC